MASYANHHCFLNDIYMYFHPFLTSISPLWRNWLARPAVIKFRMITGRFVVQAHAEEDLNFFRFLYVGYL